ncbi:hypothetical protein [Peterkaempfera sp. SMS 1(5)a]|uniref:hypothetical protein n=1 Tax=Peterkaempfera podocarpi TaxID=3232308 RepID=UPI00367221BD
MTAYPAWAGPETVSSGRAARGRPCPEGTVARISAAPGWTPPTPDSGRRRTGGRRRLPDTGTHPAAPS